LDDSLKRLEIRFSDRVGMWNSAWRNGFAILLSAWLGSGCASQQGATRPSDSVPRGESQAPAHAAEPLLVTLDKAGFVVATERLGNPSPDALRRALARHRTVAPTARVVLADGATLAQLARLYQAVQGTDLSSLALEAGGAKVEVPVERTAPLPTHVVVATADGRASFRWWNAEKSKEAGELHWSPGNAADEQALREALVRACSNEPCHISTNVDRGASVAALVPVLASFKRVSQGLPLKWPLWTAAVTTVSGRLPPAVIQSVVRAHFGVFRRCYEAGLARDPNLAGAIRTRFVIGRDGKVSNVADHGSDIPDPEVRDCVLKALYELVFPAPDGGIVTVVYPINLAPADR
jgi:hypothetical protein